MNDVRIDLSPITRQITTLGQQLASQIDGVGSEVGQVRNDLRLTGDELRQLRHEFDTFVQQTMRAQNVQQSTTKVGNLKAQLDREFGHYATVRRTSVGILQAFDVGNVSNSTVTSISEELMIQSPRYWLAPALVALAAWSRDNQEMADKSVQEAFARDKNKTSLFFALVLRRQGRLTSSVRWLRHYLASLDPTNLSREFAVILEATSYDAFGPQGQKMLGDRMTTWCAELRSRGDIVDAQVRNWAGEIGMQRQQLDDSQYAALAQVSPQWPQLKRQLESASALPEVITKYEAVRAFDAPLPTVLEDMLDDILDQLVTEYDEEELPLKREVVYHEAVIEEAGNLDRARSRADELQKALEDTTDVVSLQTMAAINPAQLGVSVQTQRIAIGVGVDDFRSAVGRFCTAFRADAIDHVALEFSPTHSNYATNYGFVGCSLRSDTPEEQGVASIRQAWKQTLDAYIQSISFKSAWYLIPGLVVLAVTVVVFFVNYLAGVVALLVGGGIVAFMGEMERKKCAAKVAKVERIGEQATENTVALYRDATAQLLDARLIYEELDEQETDLLSMIDTWPTAGHLAEERV